MNVFLIGIRGAGKTSAAKHAAQLLGAPWSWIDLDLEIERITGQSIEEVFRKSGEPAFRELERDALAKVAAGDCRVIATGGGAVELPANESILRSGFVVWLAVAAEIAAQRLASDPTTTTRRPPLTNLSPIDEIRAVLTRRESKYRELSQARIETDACTIEGVGRKIVEEMNRRTFESVPLQSDKLK